MNNTEIKVIKNGKECLINRGLMDQISKEIAEQEKREHLANILSEPIYTEDYDLICGYDKRLYVATPKEIEDMRLIKEYLDERRGAKLDLFTDSSRLKSEGMSLSVSESVYNPMFINKILLLEVDECSICVSDYHENMADIRSLVKDLEDAL